MIYIDKFNIYHFLRGYCALRDVLSLKQSLQGYIFACKLHFPKNYFYNKEMKRHP